MSERAMAFHPGIYIREELVARKWTQKQLADKLRFTPAYVSDVIGGRRGLSPSGCFRMAEVFGTSPELWWNLQCAYDFAHGRQRHEKWKRTTAAARAAQSGGSE